MAVDRPTFSESWYRVADLKPRLRSTVQIYRQQFRGQTWYVLQDPASNQFSRLSEPAYRFVGLLNGRRKVADAWRLCNDQLGDAAPTQGEAIQLLGQLYVFNLLQSELPPDAEGLFKRYQKRVRREVQGVISNLLFIRIPLFDPDRFLNAFLPAVGWIFSWIGALLWVLAVATGLFVVGSHLGALADRASGILSMDNIPLLYGSFILVKVFHELGHAFACKKFGHQQGSGGEVHTIGIMFLVFTPMPYVDTSSSWAFQKKWHRVIVGSAGMLVELVIASIAACVWAYTSQGHPLHAVAYNAMFIASVSTLLFNGNPLLRFDGYYILSDALEIPNLAQRSKDYIYYLVKRYVWGVRRPRNPATTPGERVWFFFYGIASTIYRVVICVGILWFISQKLYMVGLVLAAAAVVAWVFVPLGKFLKYVLASPELSRTRWRAYLSTGMVVVGLVVGLGFIPTDQHIRIDGVVEPVDLSVIFMREDGHITRILPTGTMVSPDGEPIIQADNVELRATLNQMQGQIEELQVRERMARAEGEYAQAEIVGKRIAIRRERVRDLQRRMDLLTVRAPHGGEWISPQVERFRGAYVSRGDPIGMVANPGNVRIRAVAGQDVASLLNLDIRDVRVRVRGRPELEFGATVKRVPVAAQEQLPSAALGLAAGGTIQTDPETPTKAVGKVFEPRFEPTPDTDIRLLSGQRVTLRLTLPKKPLAAQWIRRGLQLFQQRQQ